MSEPICPDCGSFDMPMSADKCNFCGWEGPPRPGRSLMSEDWGKKADLNRANIELKKASKLFFVRVFVKKALVDREADEEEFRAHLSKLFGQKAVGRFNVENPYYLIKADKMPTREIVVQIQKSPGVIEVIIK